jgi:hypothetical protein
MTQPKDARPSIHDAPSGKCTICDHPERVRAEMLLAGGASVKAVSRKLKMSYYPLRRHWLNHVGSERKANLVLGPVARAALASRVAEESESVLDHFKSVRAGLYQLYEATLSAGDGNTGALLAGRLHENLNSLARLTGQLASSPLVQINQQNFFVNDPQFALFQSRLIEILARHPAARDDVVAEFERLEQRSQAAALPALEHTRAQ